MRNNSYNLEDIRIIRYIFIVWMFFLVSSSIVLAEDFENSASETVGTVTDIEPSWYAIMKIDGKKKLYAKGDIFCSNIDITKCLRIQDIQKHILILKDVSLQDTFTVAPGERIPLEGTEIIFQKTVNTDVVEYRYKSSEEYTKGDVQDFTIRNLEREKVVLEKDYDNSSFLAGLSEEEKKIFDAPRMEDVEAETIMASFFEDIKVKEIDDNAWAVDSESTEAAFDNAGKVLFSTIKSVEPRFRFGEGPSLKLNCELGEIVLNRDGFLVQNLAVAKLVERAGIKQGDLIKGINGQPVNSLYGIYRAYMAFKSDKTMKVVNVDIVRDGKAETLVYKIQ